MNFHRLDEFSRTIFSKVEPRRTSAVGCISFRRFVRGICGSYPAGLLIRENKIWLNLITLRRAAVFLFHGLLRARLTRKPRSANHPAPCPLCRQWLSRKRWNQSTPSTWCLMMMRISIRCEWLWVPIQLRDPRYADCRVNAKM